MQTTAIGTVANSLPKNEVILLTLFISKRYILYTDLLKIQDFRSRSLAYSGPPPPQEENKIVTKPIVKQKTTNVSVEATEMIYCAFFISLHFKIHSFLIRLSFCFFLNSQSSTNRRPRPRRAAGTRTPINKKGHNRYFPLVRFSRFW